MATTQHKLYKVTKVKVRKPTPEKTCPHCYKKVAARGLSMHIKLAHPNEKKILKVMGIGRSFTEAIQDTAKLKEGMKVRIKKGRPDAGEIGIVLSVDANGHAEIILLKRLEKLYKEHCQ